MRRAMFIGQAMPRFKHHPHYWPTLNQWLYSIGLNDDLIKEHFCYSALVDYFPGSVNGSHIVPTQDDIDKERQRLDKTIVDFNPELIVPVGVLSISQCLNEKAQPLISYIGKKYLVDPYLTLKRKIIVVPLPHPSGASTWRYKNENQLLLEKALRILKEELNI